MGLLDLFLPVTIIIKVIIIIVLSLVTILGAYFVPRGKFIVIIVGIVSILFVWYMDLEINI